MKKGDNMKKSKTQVQSNRKISGDKVKRAAMKLISLALTGISIAIVSSVFFEAESRYYAVAVNRSLTFPDLIILASFTGAVYCGALLQAPKIFRFFDQKINKLFSKGGSK